MAGILSGHIVLASATERVALANSTQVANFTDSDLTDLLTGFTATIDWGDGTTSPGTITGSNGSFSVLGGHSYSDEGNFTLSATIVRSADNATFTDTGNIAVAEHDVLAAQGTTIIGNPGRFSTTSRSQHSPTPTRRPSRAISRPSSTGATQPPRRARSRAPTDHSRSAAVTPMHLRGRTPSR